MYYQGSYSYANPCCCGYGGYPGYGYGGYGVGYGATIILVLFILLVIILGTRFI